VGRGEFSQASENTIPVGIHFAEINEVVDILQIRAEM
jgi:hypothetical protein